MRMRLGKSRIDDNLAVTSGFAINLGLSMGEILFEHFWVENF